ncbi:MAG: FHA domain-containing protein [Actinobacteria bacterium]|nr:FHA domain-containing protein [Actinomycetota bacterium]
MATCPMCGHENEVGARFCSSCGAGFSSVPQATGVYEIEKTLDTREFPAVNPEHFQEIATGNAVLVVTRGALEGVRFTLNAASSEPIVIGRSPESSIFLDDVTVSRQHAKIIRVDGQWSITDSGSLNGTYVNRNLVTEAVLANNDDVQIGKYRFVFISNQDQA